MKALPVWRLHTADTQKVGEGREEGEEDAGMERPRDKYKPIREHPSLTVCFSLLWALCSFNSSEEASRETQNEFSDISLSLSCVHVRLSVCLSGLVYVCTLTPLYVWRTEVNFISLPGLLSTYLRQGLLGACELFVSERLAGR